MEHKKERFITDFYNYFKSSQLNELLAFGIPVNKIDEEINTIGAEGTKLIVE